MTRSLIHGVRSVELVATNLAEAGRFYESVWGLEAVTARAGTQLYRGTGAYHHILGLHHGPQPALIRIVFDVANRTGVDALHRTVAATGRPVSAPAELARDGGGYGFGCKDPDGRNLAFVAGCADHADTGDQPDRPRKIAHINLNARDFDASLRFFTDTLGFRLIDDNAPLWFLHCASPDHSSLVLAKTNQPTLNHVAFEMPDFDSVMRGMGRMKDNGYPIEWGPGAARAGQQRVRLFLRSRRAAGRVHVGCAEAKSGSPTPRQGRPAYSTNDEALDVTSLTQGFQGKRGAWQAARLSQ